MSYNRPSIGLVLSGGGARGLAHIGVLRVLEREGIPVKYLAGTSMGGLIAAGYASGMSSYDLEEVARVAVQKRHMLRMMDPGLPNGGVIRGQGILKFYKQLFGEKTFSDLRLPLAVVAVDLNTYQEVVLKTGSVAMALRATTSLPGVFMPLMMNGMKLTDGGVLNNLPVDAAQSMGAERIIAIDIAMNDHHWIGRWMAGHHWVPKGVTQTLEVIDDTIYALRIAEQRHKLQHFPPDVLISPDLPGNVNTFVGYSQVSELIEAGERATENYLQEIKALVDPCSQRFCKQADNNQDSPVSGRFIV